MKKRLCFMVMAALLSLIIVTPIQANLTATFNDVPVTHFAFHAINWVSHPDNGGIMVGDLQGNFHPNQTITKFEAARMFAMAAGFRSAAHPVAPELRAEINRSFDVWRPLIDSMAAQHPQWSRVADREIAFLLYRSILTPADVEQFMGTRLTRQEAVTWLVRLLERQAHAAAIVIPFHNPFNDNALIDNTFIRYVYYAREAGIISGDNNNMFNPADNLTRAQLAVMFYNALSGSAAVQLPGATTPVSTVSGIVELVHRNTQIFISSPLGPQDFMIAPDATIIVDNIQRTAAFIRTGMNINAVLNAQGEIISLVARTGSNVDAGVGIPVPPPPTTQPGIRLYADEGFVVAVSANPPTITIRTQRVRITGQIIDEERIFTLAQGASITRGGAIVPLSDAQINDIAFFRFNGTVIHELELEDRVRNLGGVLLERHAMDSHGNQTIVIEVATGAQYELRVTTNTDISRGQLRNIRLQDLRIGDNVQIYLESGIVTRLHAVGTHSIIDGRLIEIRVTQNFSEVTVQDVNGNRLTYTIMPGIFDVYSLRIGMDIRLFLDSWEVMDIQIMARTAQQFTAVLGNVRSIRAGQVLEIMELDGAQPRTHTIVIDSSTINTATGQPLDFNQLRVNMNIYVIMVGPHSNVARSVTILP